MAIRRHYVNTAPIPTLTAGIGTGNTTCVPTTVVGFPAAFPWTAVIDAGTATAEVVLVTAAVGSTLTITRAYGGTAAQSHAVGAVFAHVAIDADYDEANAHVTASSGVHGVAGALVGTSDVQTLTNKTIVALTGKASGVGAKSLSLQNSTGTEKMSVTDAGNIVTAGTLTTSGLASITAAAGTALAVFAVPSVAGAVVATRNVANTTSMWFVDDVGNMTALGNINGIIKPQTFTNEAARDAAITVPTAGMIVYLTAPTKMVQPGPTQYNGTNWGPIGHTRVASGSFSTDLSSTGGTEGVGYSISANLVSGRRYRITFKGYFNAGAAGNIAEVRLRYDTAAVTGSSSLAGTNAVFHANVGSSGRFNSQFAEEFVAPSTNTFNVAVGVSTVVGSGNEVIVGTVRPSLVLLDDIGV